MLPPPSHDALHALTDAPSAPEARSRAQQTTVVAVLALLAFWPSLVSFPAAWLENRLHGFALAGLAGWFLWRVRHRVPAAEHGSALVLAPLALGSVVWAVGIILNAQLLHQAMIPLLVFGWWYAIAGWPAALTAIPAAIVAQLATPFWGLFVVPLQAMTVVANSVLLSVTGIQADISGTYIAIPAGVFEVARGCSGANYFEAGIVISVIYALFFLRHWRARFLAVAVGALMAAVSNWLRVFGLIIIGQVTEMQSPLIKDHNGYGWAIFAVVIAGYFALARRFERYDDALGDQTGAVDVHPVLAAAAADADVAVGRGGWRNVLLPTGALLVGPLLVLGGRLGSAATIESLPSAVPGLAAQVPFSGDSARWTPLFVGADQHLAGVGVVDSALVQVDRFVYVQQQQGRELVNTLNALVPGKQELGSGLVGPLDERGRMVNVRVFGLDDQRWLAWQWYVVSNINTHSTMEAKLLELGAWFSDRVPSEAIILSTPCEDAECEAAGARLFRIVTGRMPPAAP